MIEKNNVLVCVRNTQSEEEVSSNTVDATKISDFYNILTSSESIVVELIMPNHIFIKLNIFFDKTKDSITARFKYDLFHLSPKYFGSEAILISIIEECGDEIFYDELCTNDKQFMQIFKSNDINIQEGYIVVTKGNELIKPKLKINYFFDSDYGEFILDYIIENSGNYITIKDLHEKAIQTYIVLSEIIKKITNSNC
jgi:hypothetical protein